MFIRFLDRLRASICWVASLKLASKERYEEALQKLMTVDRIVPNKIEVTLLKGFLYFATDKDESALLNLSSAWKMIDRSTQYSSEEKQYLQCYASFYGEKLADASAIEKYPFEVDYTIVQLDKVRKSLKDNFPLRDHPHWASYERQ